MIKVVTIKETVTPKGIVSNFLGECLVNGVNIKEVRLDGTTDTRVWYVKHADNYKEHPGIFIVDDTLASMITAIETAPVSEVIALNVFSDTNAVGATSVRDVRVSNIQFARDHADGDKAYVYLKTDNTVILVDHTIAEIVALAAA